MVERCKEEGSADGVYLYHAADMSDPQSAVDLIQVYVYIVHVCVCACVCVRHRSLFAALYCDNINSNSNSNSNNNNNMHIFIVLFITLEVAILMFLVHIIRHAIASIILYTCHTCDLHLNCSV